MLFVYFILAATLVILLGLGVTIGRLRDGPWPAATWFFLLVFFGTWFLGGWLAPFDTTPWGMRWMLGGVIAGGASLLFASAAVLFRWTLSGKRNTERQRIAVSVTVYTFLWTALFSIVLAMITQHILRALEETT